MELLEQAVAQLETMISRAQANALELEFQVLMASQAIILEVLTRSQPDPTPSQQKQRVSDNVFRMF